ncbi:MAG: hypothetical protein L0Z62_36555 [Gemmataceae bacterium]|nr:hypothetical protein [Gemmataceae bacterium]
MKPWLILAGLFVLVGASLSLGQPASPERIQRLINDLDSPQFRVREAAVRELKQLGEQAVPALEKALKMPASEEVGRRIQQLLAPYRPAVFEAHFNGWHWVYSIIAHAQTFEATGTRITSLRLRVAQLSANRPAAPLEVEVRDLKFQTIYLRGTIDPEVLQREFRWQPVALKHVSPLKPGAKYVLLFHSRDSKNTGPWAINAIYRDTYPHGHHWYTHHEDFFFAIDYHKGRSVRVGPDGEKTNASLPINSGATGGPVENGGPLQLQTFGRLPEGRLHMAPEKKP